MIAFELSTIPPWVGGGQRCAQQCICFPFAMPWHCMWWEPFQTNTTARTVATQVHSQSRGWTAWHATAAIQWQGHCHKTPNKNIPPNQQALSEATGIRGRAMARIRGRLAPRPTDGTKALCLRWGHWGRGQMVTAKHEAQAWLQGQGACKDSGLGAACGLPL